MPERYPGMPKMYPEKRCPGMWMAQKIYIHRRFISQRTAENRKNIYTYIVLLFFKKKIFFNIVESSWGNHIFFFGKKCITLILNDPKLALLIHTSKRVSFLKNQKKNPSDISRMTDDLLFESSIWPSFFDVQFRILKIIY